MDEMEGIILSEIREEHDGFTHFGIQKNKTTKWSVPNDNKLFIMDY